MSIAMIIGIVYGVGCVVSFIPIARYCTYMGMFDDVPDGEDIAMGIFMAFCIFWAWPLLIPGYWAYKVIQMDVKENQ